VTRPTSSTTCGHHSRYEVKNDTIELALDSWESGQDYGELAGESITFEGRIVVGPSEGHGPDGARADSVTINSNGEDER
jgi:hypothetical protein